MRRPLLITLVLLAGVGLAAATPVLVGHALFAMGLRGTGAVLMGNASWRGFELARAGNYAGAAEAFGTARTNAYNRGNALAKTGRYSEALDAYDEALEADPEDEDARHNKAIVAQILDKEETAPGKAGGSANARANREGHHGGNGNEDGDTHSTGIGYTGNKEGSTEASSQGGSKVSKIGKGGQAASGDNSEKASGSAGQASGRGRSGSDMADSITAQLAVNQRKYSKAFTQLDVNPTVQWLQTVNDDPGSFLKLQIRAERKRRQAIAERERGGGGGGDD